MVKYFFRLDDIAPNMNWNNFYKLAGIFNRWNIKPLLAIIPDVQDPKLLIWPANQDFWNTINKFLNSGWIIGQHGCRHLSNGNGGILKIHSSGEFGGFNFDKQKEMIRLGKEIMLKNNFNPDIFIAPRHSFDQDTIKALEANGFSFISDGIGLYPFKKWGIIWLPQILWRPRKGLFGMVTVALHSNTMAEKDFEDLEQFIKKNPRKIGNFSELLTWHSGAGVFKKAVTFLVNQPFKIFWYLIFRLKHGISK